jgi:hypothetical protein
MTNNLQDELDGIPGGKSESRIEETKEQRPDEEKLPDAKAEKLEEQPKSDHRTSSPPLDEKGSQGQKSEQEDLFEKAKEKDATRQDYKQFNDQGVHNISELLKFFNQVRQGATFGRADNVYQVNIDSILGGSGHVSNTNTAFKGKQWEWKALLTEQAKAYQRYRLKTQSIDTAISRLTQQSQRILLLTNADQNYLHDVAYSLCGELAEQTVEVRVVGNLKPDMLLSLMEKRDAASEAEAQQSQVEDTIEKLRNAWYFTTTLNALFLRQLERSHLLELEQVLRERDMGLVIALPSSANDVPMAWRNYHIELEPVDTYEQLKLFLKHSPLTLTPEQNQTIEKWLRENEVLRLYLTMNLSYDDLQNIATVLIDCASKNRDAAEVFTELYSQRMLIMLRAWDRQHRQTAAGISKIPKLIALSVLNGTEQAVIEEWGEILNQQFQHEIPVVNRSRNSEEAEELAAAEALQSHPLSAGRTDEWLREMMAEYGSEIRYYGDVERQVRVMRFRHTGFDVLVMNYYWDDFSTPVHDKMIKWLEAMFEDEGENKRRPFVMYGAARMLGLIANGDIFAEIEQHFILPKLRDYEKIAQDQDFSKFLQNLLETNKSKSEQQQKKREQHEQQQAQENKNQWVETAYKLEMLLWWGYQLDRPDTRRYIEQLLQGWMKNKDKTPLYRIVGLMCARKLGIYFHKIALPAIDRIVRVKHIEPPAPDDKFLKRYEEALKAQKISLTPITAFGQKQRDAEAKKYQEQLKLAENYDAFLQAREDQQLYILNVVLGSLSDWAIQATQMWCAEGSQDETQKAAQNKSQTSAQDAMHGLMKLVKEWIRGFESDYGTAYMGRWLLSDMATTLVKSLLPASKQSAYQNWRILYYWTAHDPDFRQLFCQTLRFMLQQRNYLREEAYDLLRCAVHQVNIQAGDDDRKVMQKRSFILCAKIIQDIAFGTVQLQDDLPVLSTLWQFCEAQGRLFKKEISDKERRIWTLLAHQTHKFYLSKVNNERN